MKITKIILRILLILLLIMPVLGTLGVFPAPTADLYTPQAWAFMSALMATGYMMPLLGITCAVCLVLFIIGRTALGAVILAPFTVNVVLFHAFLDATPVSAASSMGWMLLILNAFFLWTERKKYKALW
ncbi:MAG: hypothetical protein KBD00_06160 [Candidatus Peribacteraceae bacterium]|nr:hypothetical protein [Candidatus Peribacteraceae bacterium]